MGEARRLAVGAAVAVIALAVATLLPSGAPASAPRARIAFAKRGRIFTIKADGSRRVRLTNGSDPQNVGFGDHQPAWSHDGRRIAFARFRTIGNDAQGGGIDVVDAADGDHHVVARPRPSTFYVDPEWSPGDRQISAIRLHERDTELVSAVVLMRPDGSGRHAIARIRIDSRTHRFVAFYGAIWSPDGRHLLVTREHIDQHAYFQDSLLSMNRNGKRLRRLAPHAGFASFSPDGSRIAYVDTSDRHGHSCDEDNCVFSGEIYVAHRDGALPIRLTRTRADEGAPDWSADGRRLVFQRAPVKRDLIGAYHLLSISPSGKCATKLTSGKGDTEDPDWEPDPSRSSASSACR